MTEIVQDIFSEKLELNYKTHKLMEIKKYSLNNIWFKISEEKLEIFCIKCKFLKYIQIWGLLLKQCI